MIPTLTFRHVDRDVFDTPASERRPNPFDTTYDRTLQQLGDELRHLEATDVVAGVVLDGPAQVRQDGMLRSRANVLHPGVVLTISSRQHGTLVYSCDQFAGRYTSDPPDWQINLRAITVGLHDLRRLERYGIAKRGQQYAGWKELGTGTTMGGASHDDASLAHFLATAAGWPEGSLDPHDHQAVRQAYRDASRRHHPDVGGNPAMMAYVNNARDALLPEG